MRGTYKWESAELIFRQTVWYRATPVEDDGEDEQKM